MIRYKPSQTNNAVDALSQLHEDRELTTIISIYWLDWEQIEVEMNAYSKLLKFCNQIPLQMLIISLFMADYFIEGEWFY